MDRRSFLLETGVAALALPVSGCRTNAEERVGPSVPNEETRRADEIRSGVRPSPSGNVVEVELTAGALEKRWQGGTFSVFGYNGRSPGPEIRLKERDILRVRVKNRLPDGTTIHWHGLPVPNAMDGVPGVTQESIPPGQSFTYEFPSSLARAGAAAIRRASPSCPTWCSPRRPLAGELLDPAELGAVLSFFAAALGLVARLLGVGRFARSPASWVLVASRPDSVARPGAAARRRLAGELAAVGLGRMSRTRCLGVSAEGAARD